MRPFYAAQTSRVNGSKPMSRLRPAPHRSGGGISPLKLAISDWERSPLPQIVAEATALRVPSVPSVASAATAKYQVPEASPVIS